MENWVYILNPKVDTLDGEPSTSDTLLRHAERTPELDLWLSQCNRMVPGDRLWFFFGLPESAIAAVAEVDEAPRSAPQNAERPYRVRATVLLEASRALHGEPVDRADLELGQVRSVQKVKPGALAVLLERSGL
ncbi:hypothetical protein [Streptomyces mirabilis]|uniref:hypothetical protein n=1 Tax=Streptomyces mirabilis TaxID=68239 RepID=UPI00331CE838